MPKTLVTPRTPPPVHLHCHKTLRDSYRQRHPVETEVLMAKDLYIFCRATGNQIATTRPSSPRAATHLWNDLPAREAAAAAPPPPPTRAQSYIRWLWECWTRRSFGWRRRAGVECKCREAWTACVEGGVVSSWARDSDGLVGHGLRHY